MYIGELFVALLLRADSLPCDETGPAGEDGFRENRTGEPPSEDDVSRAIHGTSNFLTGTGKATVLEALRARATGPREILWP